MRRPVPGGQLVGVAGHQAEPGAPVVEEHAGVAGRQAAADAVEVGLDQRDAHAGAVPAAQVGRAAGARRRSPPDSGGVGVDGIEQRPQSPGRDEIGGAQRDPGGIGDEIDGVGGHRPVGLDEVVGVQGGPGGRAQSLGDPAAGEGDVTATVGRDRPPVPPVHRRPDRVHPVGLHGCQVLGGDEASGGLGDRRTDGPAVEAGATLFGEGAQRLSQAPPPERRLRCRSLAAWVEGIGGGLS